ncbi:MAG: SUF system NifU family Fe-S cluster assembly protein [candidate division Zixibacteria bacterium]|nr:SUF system NifU family Fe-S cluster assembly protein [candidate division Zixibacteria bacterium]MDH3937120.1 SUF system NifU family Fe-S cluster assembly protein [candidate division Zixibacteria bacterium]MDH4034599.1 SUF system NifU family Fe-S cluster assembly protein [candidate division Zixibacteria bacterium]
MSEPLDDMYRDIIMDHFRSPRGKKPLEQVDISSDGSNPACGDELELKVQMDDGTLKNIHVDCKGCAISVASGSMLAEIIKGRPLEEARRIAELVRRMLKGEVVELPDDLGDIDALQGVRQFPVRIKCALLSWVTLIEGLNNFEKGRSETDSTVTTEDNQ